MGRQNTLEQAVRLCLQVDEASRNSDIRLMRQVWERYHKERIHHDALNQPYIYLHDLDKLPREDHIKRVRAKIQNVDKEYLPTNAEVAKNRGWEIEDWRKYLGYPERNYL